MTSSQSLPEGRTFRYERKFLVNGLHPDEVAAVVRFHPAMFLRAYPNRSINNIYFDSPDRHSLRQAVEGEKDRLKVRIRWYGDLRGVIPKPILELKIKHGLLGTKTSYPLVSFQWNETFQNSTVQQVFQNSELPPSLLERLLLLEPLLVNRYHRSYSRSADSKFRMTLDSQLEYHHAISRSRFHRKAVDRESTVLEVKYDEHLEPAAQAITRHLPFRLTKSSKYVMGLQRLDSP